MNDQTEPEWEQMPNSTVGTLISIIAGDKRFDGGLTYKQACCKAEELGATHMKWVPEAVATPVSLLTCRS